MSEYLFNQSVAIAPGQQFLGTEFSALPSIPANRVLEVKELVLTMGPEAKDWKVEKVFTVAGFGTVRVPILAATASTVQRVFALDPDVATYLLPGEELQITTAAATAAMAARIQYADTDEPGLRG